MMDKVTIDELKVFVGTGLCFFDTHRDLTSELSWVSQEEFCIENYGGDWPICHCGKTFKPVLRTWSHLTKEIEHNGERFVPMFELYGAGDGDIDDGNFSFVTRNEKCTTMLYGKDEVVMSLYHNAAYLSHKEVVKLCSWHFDVFNWLSRTGEDGQPLAVEMIER